MFVCKKTYYYSVQENVNGVTCIATVSATVGDVVSSGSGVTSRRATIAGLAVSDPHPLVHSGGIEHRAGRGGSEDKTESKECASEHGELVLDYSKRVY